MRRSWLVGLAAALAWTCVQAQERTGYRLWRSQVVVEGEAHWRAWETGEGARAVDADGAVRPRFMRRDIDAVRNATDFVNAAEGDTTFGGISAVGVRADTLTAPLIIDGDMSTFWEPDLDAEPENLWVEVDLGRTVIARRVVVRFVEEGLGDPFLKFRVLVSDGAKEFGASRRREFVRVGQVAAPNKEQREFVFDIEPFRPVPEGIEGEPVQFVRVDLLDSDGPRGREVSRERHFLLPPEDKGAVDYFRITAAGRQIPVIQETYDRLPLEERGPVRYYRRERPRLAELEVHALGDNVVALTQRALLAEGDFFEDLARRLVTDGLLLTSFQVREYDRFRDRQQVTVDLGARFWLERIRLLTIKDPLTSYQLRVSDGSLDASGEYLWHDFEERLNQERFLQVEERFPPREVRLIELRRLDLLRENRLTGLLSELQAYGEGYVSDVLMTSPLVKLEQRRMISRVRWDGDAPPGTSLEIRTRSGDELILIPRYYNRYGREISAALYERYDESERGPTLTEEIPAPDWSEWSEPYRMSGEAFRSPAPRRMTLVQVRLRSTEPLRCASIRSLFMDFAPPLVDQAVAEIWPVRGVTPGVDQEFRLHVRPLPGGQDPGFDRLRLSSSSTAPIELAAVRRGSEQALRSGQAELLWPGPLRVEEPAAGELELVFPETVARTAGMLELVFRTRIFLPLTAFRIELRNSQLAGMVQQVDPGDASGLLDSGSLIVGAGLREGGFLGTFEVQPRTFTPNGDGINDQATVRLSVFQLEGARRIRLEVCDLTGRRLRDLSLQTQNPSGEHRILWDGRDDRGELLSPGIYLLRASLSADTGDVEKVRPVGLAY